MELYGQFGQGVPHGASNPQASAPRCSVVRIDRDTGSDILLVQMAGRRTIAPTRRKRPQLHTRPPGQRLRLAATLRPLDLP
jgi:hypothetical protein